MEDYKNEEVKNEIKTESHENEGDYNRHHKHMGMMGMHKCNHGCQARYGIMRVLLFFLMVYILLSIGIAIGEHRATRGYGHGYYNQGYGQGMMYNSRYQGYPADFEGMMGNGQINMRYVQPAGNGQYYQITTQDSVPGQIMITPTNTQNQVTPANTANTPVNPAK